MNELYIIHELFYFSKYTWETTNVMQKKSSGTG